MPFSSSGLRRVSASLEGQWSLGLLTDEGEIADPNYQRQPVDMRQLEDGLLVNTGEIRFPRLADDAGPITGWLLVDATGVELGRWPTAARTIGRGERPFVDDQEVEIRLEG